MYDVSVKTGGMGMILKRVIEHCYHLHNIYEKDIPCSHCRYKGYTCEHTCKVLMVKKPFEYTIINETLNRR